MAKQAKKNKKTSPTMVANRGVGVEPLGDRVLIKPVEKEDEAKTKSGIYLPDSAKEDRGGKLGKVVAVGEGKYDDGKLIPIRVKPGQTVLYSWGDTIKHNGEEYVVVREPDILAIIR